MKVRRQKWTKEKLLKIGIPAVLIPGFLAAIVLGWNPKILDKNPNYRQIKTAFPDSGIVERVTDGDTFVLNGGVTVRMLGIDAPNTGDLNYDKSRNYLISLVQNKRVDLEYDRYQDDKYGRILAWVWAGCESKPRFLPSDYMHLSGNASREDLVKNPDGCQKGFLVNEMLVEQGLAKTEIYKDRGELKYEKLLNEP